MALSYPEAVLGTAGLVRYWRLQETGAASVAVEETGSGDNLTINGAAVGLPGGLSDGGDLAHGFDGVNDYLDGGVIAAINALNRPVYEWIFYLASDHKSQVGWFAHGSQTAMYHGRTQVFNGTVMLDTRLAGDGANLFTHFSQQNLNLNGWNHILWHAGARHAVVNGSTKIGGFDGYDVATNADQLVVGCYLNFGTLIRFYDGQMSEFAVYDGTSAPFNSAGAFNATALEHYQAMHTVFGGATIESASGITARGARMRTGAATIESAGSITAEGHRVRPPQAYPLKAVVTDSRTKAVLR